MLVMDESSKNSNNLFYKTSMDPSGWMKKKIKKYVIVAK